jgi:nitrous oxidase accessory protein NosD
MGFRIDDIVTGVPAIEVTASDDVFDLSGIKVRNKGEELKDLDPGVYISRGKKFLIK